VRTDPAATLRVAPVDVTPGLPTTAVVSVENNRSMPCSFALTVSGLEPAWFGAPEVIGPVAPRSTSSFTISITLPIGYPPSSLMASVSARPLTNPDGSAPSANAATAGSAGTTAAVQTPDAADQPSGRASCDLQVVVGDSAAVAVRLEPANVEGRRRGRFTVVLRNRQEQSQAVRLSGQAPETEVSVRFSPAAPLLQPGRELRVQSQVRARARLVGAERRHPFAVQVHSRGRPVTVEGSFTSHPLLPKRAAKILALATVLALWAGVAVLGISALSSHLHSTATAKAAAAAPTAAPVGNGVGGSGSGSGSGSGTSSSNSSGSPAGGATSTVAVSGKVGGPSPGGVAVTIAPTSLVAPQTLGATEIPAGRGVVTTAAIDPPTAAPVGKVFGTLAAATLFPELAASVIPDLATVTAPDGSFVFNGIPAPGTYLVTLAKAGYTTRKYVIQVTGPGDNITLDTSLNPGTGSLSGEVTGPSGPLGGVSITATDGAVTLTTSTPTQGSGVGTWSLDGLSTPGNYLVTASAAGYGTQTTAVDLGPSASRSGVVLHLVPGVGSIAGTVESATTGAPVGGVTVSATNGTTTVHATTSTVSPVGSYILPNLAIPATWTLTIGGTGWTSQTQSVTLTGNTTVNASLTPSGANVVGVVSSNAGTGLANVGLTLAGQGNTFKTLSESAAPLGGFDFGQIPPGHYVLTATDYGYTSESAQVDVSAGQTQTVDLTLPYVGQADENTAIIQGTVDNLFTAAPVPGVAIDVDGQTTGAVTSSTGTFSLSGLAPGLHTVTAIGNPLGYANASVQVSTTVGATVVAPAIELPKLDTLTGNVTSAATGALVANPTVVLLQGGQPAAAPVSATSTAAGAYTITGISAGSYVLEVSAPNYETSDVAITLGADQDVTENVSLDFGPSFAVVTYADTQTGTVPVSNVCVTVSNSTETTQPPIVKTSTGSQALDFDGLVSGDTYIATFAEPPSGGSCTNDTSPVATAPPYTFTATPDNTSVYSAFLAPSFAGTSIALSFPLVTVGTGSSAVTEDCPVMEPGTSGGSGSGSPCPTVSTLPVVTLTGTTGFVVEPNGSTGPAETATVAATPPEPGNNVWTFSATALTKFIAPQVTLHVTDTAGQFEPYSPTSPLTLSTSTTTTPITAILTPTPVPITGTITPSSGVSVTVDPGTIAPSSTVGVANTLTSSDTVSATEASGGGLDWSDPATGAGGLAQPGVYRVTFAATGYDSSTETVTVPLCSSPAACQPVSVTAELAQQATLVVTPTIPAGVSSFGPPTITLLYDGAPIAGVAPVTADSATFTSALSPAEVAAAVTAGDSGYTFTVSGSALATYTSTTLDPAGAPLVAGVPTLSESPSITADGYLTGNVVGILVPSTGSTSTPSGATTQIQGASITATLNSGCADPGDFSPSLTATSDSSGNFTVLASPSGTTPPLDSGLCVGATYDVSVSASGYTSDTGIAVVATTGANSPTTLNPANLAAIPVNQTIDVTGVTSGTSVTVTGTSLVGPTISQTQTATGTSVTFTFTGVDPVPYTFTVQAAQYESVTIGPLPYSPGGSPGTQTVSLPAELNPVTGTVTLAGSGSTTVPIAGLPLSLVLAAGNGGAAVATATTGTSGQYTFSPEVPPGSYRIVVGDGYTVSPAPTITTTPFTPGTVTDNFTVTANAVPVTLAVSTSGASGNDIDGATVTLTPESGATVPQSCTAPSGSSTATNGTLLVAGLGSAQQAQTSSSGGTVSALFSSVTPDVYTVAITGNGVPPQTPTTLVVCPGGATSPTTPTVTVAQGALTGTVSLTTESGASLPTITVTATPTSGSPLTTSCAPSSSTSASCSLPALYLTLGTTYTLVTSAPGYTSSASTSAEPTAGNATISYTPAALQPAPVEVTVPLAAGSSPPAGIDGATVTLSQGSTTSYTTQSNNSGVATFSTFAPSSTTYEVGVTPSESGAADESDVETVTVPIGSSPVTAGTVTLETGTVSGTITFASATTAATTLTVSAGTGTAAVACDTVDAAKGATTEPYTCTLPIGTYTITAAAPGYITTSTTTPASITTAGATSTGNDITLPAS